MNCVIYSKMEDGLNNLLMMNNANTCFASISASSITNKKTHKICNIKVLKHKKTLAFCSLGFMCINNARYNVGLVCFQRIWVYVQAFSNMLFNTDTYKVVNCK